MRLPFLQEGGHSNNRLQGRLGRFFHRNNGDYLGILQALSDKTKASTDPDYIIMAFIEAVALTVKADKAMFLLADEELSQFIPVSPVDKTYSPVSLPSGGMLASLLRNTGDIMTRREVEIMLEFQALTASEQDFLTKLDIEMFVPVNSRDSLTGILALGRTLSGRDYSPQERALLRLLSDQVAVTLDNAHLYMLEKKTEEELQREFKERTEFVDALIHEVKTPLTAMLAYAELLKEELAAGDPVLNELASNMNDAVHSLNRRISELVNFTKLQHTEITLNLSDVYIDKVINDSVSQTAGLLIEKKQTIRVEIQPSMGPVRCDPDRLMQILMNLLTNAVKYGPAGDTLLLKAYQLNDDAIIGVHDSGQSLTPEEQESLFAPYQQGPHKTEGGLGLGLYICKQLVELHGGKIWLESKAKGNEFKFSLPLVNREA